MDELFQNADYQNDIFQREHQTALRNLHNCSSITSNLMTDLQTLRHDIDHKRKQECIALYKTTMKILTSFSEIFRQFNIEIQTTSYKLDANVRDCGGGGGGGGGSNSGSSGGGLCNINGGTVVMTNGYHHYDDTDYRLKEFIYPKYDITIYKENYVGDGVVAHVENSDLNLCFIIDAERAYDQNLYETLGMELNRLPLPGEVFGIDLGSDGVFRAVRDNNVNMKRKQKLMKVLLIDTGEIIEVDADTNGKFALSESAQKIPGRCIRCKVEEIFDEDGITKCDESTLNLILYESMRFRVTKVHNNLLYIKVYRKDSSRFEELTCNTDEPILNGGDHTSAASATALTSHVYRNASTLNPFATEFSYKYLNNSPAFYTYQNQSNIDGSPTTHQMIDDFSHLSTNHSIPYVINQNCPPLANTANVEYTEYLPTHATVDGITTDGHLLANPSRGLTVPSRGNLPNEMLAKLTMVMHHSSPPIPLQTVQPAATATGTIQTIQSVSQHALQYYQPTTTNVVELFPDVYQNDEASFRETNLGKYDSTNNIKRMQNHLISGGACFVPALTSPTGTIPTNAVTHDNNSKAIITSASTLSSISSSSSSSTASTVRHRNAGSCSIRDSGRSPDNRNSHIRPLSVDNKDGGGTKARTTTPTAVNNTIKNVDDTRLGTESPRDKNDHSDSIDSLKSGANCNRTMATTTKSKRDVNDLTKEQLDELYEEPLGTSNALKAVMGYAPKDDRRICKHYDPKTKGCFKGNNCKLEHVAPIKDGWTRDRAPLKISIHATLPMPSIDQSIKLIPTFIVSVEEFYAQIPDLAVKSGMSLIKLNETINSAENRNRYRRYTKLPELYELVLATYKSNYYYRAKVLEVKENSVLVFYVDYGNCSEVFLRNIYLWEDRWDHIPFQAYRCRMAGIKALNRDDIETIKEFRKMIYNKRLTAKITSNVDDLFVRLIDDQDCDIGEKLISLKFAKQNDALLPSAGETNGLPG